MQNLFEAMGIALEALDKLPKETSAPIIAAIDEAEHDGELISALSKAAAEINNAGDAEIAEQIKRLIA